MIFLKKIKQTNLFRIASLNSLSIILRFFIGLITSKVIAVFIGPSGLALLGNFRNFVASLETVSTLGFQNGIVKYIAETKEKELEFRKYVSTACISITFVSVILSCFLFYFSEYWNSIIFGSHFDYGFVFKAFAFALPWYALSLVLISIINGLGEFKNVIYINAIGNCIGLLVSVFFIYYYQIYGALLAIIITPSLLFLVSFYYINKQFSILTLIRFNFYDLKIIKNLSNYFLMAFVSGIAGSFVFLAIRKNIITTLGIQYAGYWEAMTRISSYYLVFISSILTLYFLPKLVIAKNNQETKKIFFAYYKTILPFIVLGLLLLYLSRFVIIKILFTNDFLPVASLFFWQLLGDLFKTISWILGYQFFAKKLTVSFIVTELFSFFITYFSSIFLIKTFGIQGVVISYSLTYFVYLIVLGIYFRKSLFGNYFTIY